jgi:hypothetical protein
VRFLQKPYAVAELVAMLGALLDGTAGDGAAHASG